ncbi:ribbon-helix-helix protein, CopG family [Altererythrobacter sp. H2]|uniref:ribbon-helix-helix protein, CopG family n=1 Tax=Altererythrobacter sp. H2 TaxID=3108391 RepID=UPI002B4BFF47|nr:ribbon-helix-helix protein, CopG family [Altererythrobacter sp. H2]WRK96800.1 ribbon-helix-helix protein, CopG family [Altererythrobacter sp. H2]
MTRILADLPDDDITWLDQLAAEQGKSRAQVLREAVAGYRAHSPGDGNKSWIRRGAGLWKHRTDIPEGLEYQRAIREDRTPHEDI